MQFTPLSDKDFDAYLENKWQSNAFNRERLEVKEKLLALGRLLGPITMEGDGSILECEASAEHPALWNQHRVENQTLFFSRSKTARKELDTIISKNRTMAALIEDPSPLRNHIFLSVMINSSHVELALKLHSDAAVDRDNLLRKSQEFFQREKLLTLIRNLPERFSIGIAGGEELPVAEIDDERLQELIQAVPAAQSWLVTRCTLQRDDPLMGQPEFVDFVKESLSRLRPMMEFIAWSRDNDFVSVRDTLKEKEIKQRSKGLAKNDRIRVVRGVFNGRTGVVEEIGAKGGLKIRLGSMLVKLSGDDVVKI